MFKPEYLESFRLKSRAVSCFMSVVWSAVAIHDHNWWLFGLVPVSFLNCSVAYFVKVGNMVEKCAGHFSSAMILAYWPTTCFLPMFLILLPKHGVLIAFLQALSSLVSVLLLFVEEEWHAYRYRPRS
jgi:hypothetical protein